MLDDLKNWLRERFEREEYFEYMTGQDPSSPAWLIMMAVGGALYALNLIFPALAKAIAAAASLLRRQPYSGRWRFGGRLRRVGRARAMRPRLRR